MYTKYDWASDRFARLNWQDEEDRMMSRIDKSLRKRTTKSNRKNHRNYA